VARAPPRVSQVRAISRTREVNEQLNRALVSRVVIEQAQGMVAERAGLTLEDAFVRMRCDARSNRLRLTDVARQAIDGTLEEAAWAS
jgi:AmiR/NasT family two-component response regulator